MLPLKIVADTNVLHSQVARELLVILGIKVAYCREILQEWSRLFPGSTLPGSFELLELTPYLPVGLPDPHDEPILACAQQAGAHALLTFNLRDFPQALSAVRIIGPDEFFCEQSERLGNVSEEFAARMNRARLHKLSRKLRVR